ncbi:FAD/FMN-containing dehydrogenase [Kibdelosporangium banguiense]|uniref:Delta(24)-sterol reductase n=1 Tax=Kibdelosporangium banguiense TaxID=1365924 RepID=A0ABS4TU18_9PSEU|nr:FAD-binding oxidoreductase [Kibdelosporangium banguiense]MBP2327916.1 FAD/FMN-containing dehydrogenase [Kibdelosporangium banguiense]
MPADHDRAVEVLRQNYRALPDGASIRLAKPTSNLFRPRARPHGAGLDVSGFDQVLSIDPQARTADVQGMVTYANLTEATLAHGLLPPVVLDFKTITLGGAAVGLGAESSSFRAGLPHDPVTEMEILTGDGRVVVATSDNEHADLFHGFPHSYASLGYALRLKIDLEPAKPYVRLKHMRLKSVAAWTEAMTQACADERADFVDGVYFGPGNVCLTLGTFTDETPYLSGYTGKQIYYRSIGRREEDYLTVRDYLWRWDTDMFWTSRLFGLENPVLRRVVPGRVRTSENLRRLMMYDRRLGLLSGMNRLRGRRLEWVLQDADVPAEAVGDFLDFFDREVGLKPVWLCPMRVRREMSLYPMQPGQLWVSVGFWGPVTLRAGQAPDHHNRLIEREIAALHGLKPLYSTTHYDEDEFWQHYRGDAYWKLKDVYDPDRRLPSLYEKCVLSR